MTPRACVGGQWLRVKGDAPTPTLPLPGEGTMCFPQLLSPFSWETE